MKSERSWTTALVIGVITLTSGGWLIDQGVAGEVVESRRLLDEVHRLVAERFVDEVSPDELYQMAIEGMLGELGDPYTDFLDPRDWENLRYSTTGNYGGLGVRIDSKDGWITVVQVLPNSPALEEGLVIGDRILEVEGESAEDWSQEKAVSVLRGEKGDPVNITIGRVGVDQPLRYRIVRDEIHVVQAQGFMLAGRIGFVQLRGFSRQAQEELVETIDGLIEEEDARGLILDLRANPGGLLEEGIRVTDLFLDSGVEVVETRSRLPDQNYTYRAPSDERYPDIPIVVLTDRYSASASEIVAGALQDHDRAVIVGTTTFGKGSVQTLYGLTGNNRIKITTARWFTPVGRSIQKDFDEDAAVQNLVASAVSISGEPVSPVEERDREAFRTDGGRIVYGGGGITPDLTVMEDTLTTDEQKLRLVASRAGAVPQNVVFRWAVEWAQNHDVPRDFEVTDAMRDAVFAALQEAEAGVDRDLFDRSLHYVDWLIAVELSGAAFGENEQLRTRALRSAQVGAALEMLRQAESPAALLSIAAREAEARSGEDDGSPGGGN